MDDDDHAPVLTDDAAAEIMGLVRLAVGDKVSDECVIGGDVSLVMESVLDHDVNDNYSVWLTGTSINVSFCPACAAVSLCAIAPVPEFIHACIEVMEHLRNSTDLGGDPDLMTCTYRRVPIVMDEDEAQKQRYAYTFAGNFWLDFDDVDDRVFHATRSLVAVIDEVSGLISAIEEYRRHQN